MSALDKLAALEAAATKGPWVLHTGCSWRRISTPDCDGNVLRPTNHPVDRHPDLEVREADAALLVAARNALPALLEVARVLRKLAEAGSANRIDANVNDLPHGNLVGFPIDRRDDAKKWCALLNEADAALAALDKAVTP